MSNGLSNVVDDLGEQDRERECEGRTGRCPQCEREGFPILPVRYAVCKNIESNEDIPELPSDRVGHFTKINLRETLEDGQPRNKRVYSRILHHEHSHPRAQVSKYILRQLRPGYFYVFDQQNHPYYWYAYVVSEEGMFHQYSVRDTPPTTQNASFSCLNAPEDERRRKALSASIVTLPRVEKGDVFYYAYTEHPWSRDHLSMIEGDSQWREDHMQKFTITGKSSEKKEEDVNTELVNGETKNTFSIDELEMVAEFCDSAPDRRDFFWPPGSERQLFSREEMKENMRDRLSEYASWLQGQELIIAVNDEVGIIDELNSYRLEPLAELKEFVDVGDNKRMLGIMQALDAFRENFINGQRKALEEKYGEQGRSNREKDLRRDLDEMKSHLTKPLVEENRRYIEGVIETLEAQIEEEVQKRRNKLEEEAEYIGDLVEEREDQLEDFYDENKEAVDEFRGRYNKKLEIAEYMTQYYDADYAFWVRDHLQDALDRYSQSDYIAGLEASGVMVSLLAGGILSPSSFSAWKALAEKMSSAESVLTRSLFANHGELVEAALNDASLPDSDDYLSVVRLAVWQQRFNAVWEDYDSSMKSELEKQWQTTIPYLITTIGNAISAISMQSQESDTVPIMMFARVAQILYCSDPAVKRGELPPLEMLRVEANVETYRRWLLHVAKDNDERRQPRPRSPVVDDAIQFPGGEGGNIAVVPAEDSGAYSLSFRLPMVNGDAANIDGFDREDFEKLEDDNTWGNVGLSKSLVNLGTMQMVSSCVLSENMGKSIVSVISIVEAVKTILEKGPFSSGDKESTDDAMLFAAIGSLVKSSVELKNSIQAIRTFFDTGEIATAATGFWRIRPEKLTLLNVIGAGGDVLAIYDGFNKMSEAGRASKSGLSDEMVAARHVQGGLSILSGSLGLMTLFIAGGPLTVAALLVSITVLVLAWIFVELVVKAVYMWVDLSLIGNHKGQIEPFRSAEEELASLDLVFKGLTVDIQWENVIIYERSDGELVVEKPVVDGYMGANITNGKRFFINSTIPDLREMRVEFDLFSGGLISAPARLLLASYEKFADKDTLEREGTSLTEGDSVFNKEEGIYSISDIYSYFDSDMISNQVNLRIRFVNGDSSASSSALFVVRW